ncbi:uncharacterized protein EI97DRAFT_432940 [Westerdykella ornata]|uniref:Uncharacterized protein n=1 Tax=Westerdykella ornata TaxID=318751 RepID=A0A6A6JKQ3_WESOR|nr:uncharacterized protein EI97DRAFT_432940 [Westerdykella ornata]KAF2276693.1 hypothetical protein EI97DRAFT_432940 [Westerdykella ornata]
MLPESRLGTFSLWHRVVYLCLFETITFCFLPYAICTPLLRKFSACIPVDRESRKLAGTECIYPD